MARSFCNVKFVSALISNGVSAALNRSSRNFSATATQGVVMRNVAMKKQGGSEEKGKADASAWIPDPVTGYYRPENSASDISVAELREMLLNNKSRQN